MPLDCTAPSAIAVLGGARGTNEDAYAWARLAKGVIGTDNVDAQLGDGLPAEVVLGLPRAEIADCDRAAAIVLLGPDLKEELPVLHLRVRRAAVELGVPVIDLAAAAHGAVASTSTCGRRRASRLPRRERARARGAAVDDPIANARRGDRDREGPVVVVLGRGSLAESRRRRRCAPPRALARPSPTSGSSPRCAAATCTARSSSGSRPGFLPGRVTLDDGPRRGSTAEWGAVPRPNAASTPPASCDAAADGQDRTCSCSSAPTRSPTSPTRDLAAARSTAPAR